jgi:hypothetical protein
LDELDEYIERVGIKQSLMRRYARFDEIEKIWVAGSSVQDSGCSNRKEFLCPHITMTWKEFSEAALPDAKSIEYYVDFYSYKTLVALTTAEYTDAAPILVWDEEDNRNPFSWHTIHRPDCCGLSIGYCIVTGICCQPGMWKGGFPRHGEGVVFLLHGAKGNAFNANEMLLSQLKPRYRNISGYIKRYMLLHELDVKDGPHVCGIKFGRGKKQAVHLRVTSDKGKYNYRVFGWE